MEVLLCEELVCEDVVLGLVVLILWYLIGYDDWMIFVDEIVVCVCGMVVDVVW